MLLATEQERVKVQNAADGLVRDVPVITVDERELETVNADSRREPGNLLGNGGVAENLGVELRGFISGAVAPQGA